MLRFIGFVIGLASFVVACEGSGGGPPSAFAVSGKISGLAGTGLVLRNNGGDDLPAVRDGAIAFPTKIASGAAYNVTVYTQPTSPAETCAVTNGSGTMGSNDVSNVAVSCTFDPFMGFVSGPYRYIDISGSDARSGTVAFDGVGGYSGSYVVNSSGVISSGTIAGSYTAAVGGAFTVDAYIGAVSADGSTTLSANPQAASVDVEIKQGQTNFTNADFSGVYQVTSVNSANSASTLTLSADGAGSYSGTLVQNNSGEITSSAATGTYSVGADGAFTFAPASGNPLRGGISAGGKTLVLSQLTAGQPPAFAVGIQRGEANFNNDDVIGTYNIVASGGPSFYSAELMSLDFDGGGNFGGTITLNESGSNSSVSATGTYTVAADGTLTVTFIQPCIKASDGCYGAAYTGGVSSDGNTLVMSYGRLGGGGTPPTTVAVGIRLQPGATVQQRVSADSSWTSARALRPTSCSSFPVGNNNPILMRRFEGGENSNMEPRTIRKRAASLGARLAIGLS
jgi:hypothetical protein